MVASPDTLASSVPSRHDGEVIELNEPQIWTLIGVFAAALFGMLTLMSTMLTRLIRAEMRGLSGEIGGLKGEIGGLGAEIRRVEEVLSTKIDHLDRDVSSIARRGFGDPPAA